MKANSSGMTRRNFLALSGAVASASLLTTSNVSHAKTASRKKNRTPAQLKNPNILFIFTDQERYFSKLPSAFPMPGHERLAKMGTTFTSHQISSCMCTSSRSVILTGLQTPDNGMFDNVDMPYVKNMRTDIPTYGHILREAGYYTAYKGKWHLNRNFESSVPEKDLTREMDAYGFSDFSSPGDDRAHELGGYSTDSIISSSAIDWLRTKGQQINTQGKPWSLSVSLVNPHDIMYFNADAPNENHQDTGKLLMHAARAPEHAFYKNDWKYPLPASLRQPIDEAGRPKAHEEYKKAWGYCLGDIPIKNENWNRFINFYFNSMKMVDNQLDLILTELDNLGLTENTIIVFTADHGEMAGSHGLRGKGPFAYREITNVPMYIVHPDVKGGRKCDALSSHIDIAPTLLSMAGLSAEQISNFAGRNLPGKNMATVLSDPSGAQKNAIRDQALFIYSGIATNDSETIRIIAEAKAQGKNPKKAIEEAGYKPNLMKRGSLRSVFDGRYKFTRYFAPVQRNTPQTIDDLYAKNDVELFDLNTDPNEMTNLAVDRNKHAQLIQTMSAKLEASISAEFGKDDAREMPNFPGVEWGFDKMDL